jgi:predicted transcriptional regulator
MKQFTHNAINRIDFFLSRGGAHELGLSPFDICVLFAIGSYLRKNEQCWPSQKTIQSYVPASIESIKRSIKKLVQKNIIAIKKIGRKNHYTIKF